MVINVKNKDNCVCCPPEMGCLYDACPMLYEVQMRCDVCKCEADDLYRVDDVDMCEDCFGKTYIHITSENCCDYMTE